jgi:predicted secreted protein
MGPVSGIVLYVVIWSMVFFVALPIRIQTQGDLGQIVPGTQAGSPEHHHLKKKALWTTVIAFFIWAICAYFILWEVITVDDIERWLSPNETPIGGTSG